MPETKKITDLNTLADAVLHLVDIRDTREQWWRGQATPWKLVPKIFRGDLAPHEHNLFIRFVSKAKPRHTPTPAFDDVTAWLFLMQHYGLPTRLLDWSASPLVALFFAVQDEKDHSKPGVIWALDPVMLNKNQHNLNSVLSSDYPLVIEAATDALNVPGTKTYRKFLSVLPAQTDIRHLVQSTAFTIHGSPTPIEELPGSDTYLTKFEVPADAKSFLRNILSDFQISESTLFPDLENLAKELTSKNYRKS
jgi:hypothetical protein